MRGYTLIELLVVGAIVAVLVTTTALAWRSDPARHLEAEANRLAAQIELALSRARIGGARIALSIDAEGYRFWQREPAGVWQATAPESGLGPRSLPAGIDVTELRLAGIPVARGERVALDGEADTAVSITLAGQGARAIVASSAYFGRMDVRMVQSER